MEIKCKDNICYLSYCTNILEYQDIKSLLDTLEFFGKTISSILYKIPKGIGLYFNRQILRLLKDSKNISLFVDTLKKNNLYITGVNGFSYNKFHRKKIKWSIYEPDWSTPERLEYTKSIASILTELKSNVSPQIITTVPVGASSKFNDKHKYSLAIKNILNSASYLNRILENNGVFIVLAMEPEPLCVMENLQSSLEVMVDILSSATEAQTNHIGLCIDLSHIAVMFDDPIHVIRTLSKNNIKISKIHLSSAIQTSGGENVLKLLKFIESTYLHQTVVLTSNKEKIIYPDLTKRLIYNYLNKPEYKIRVHYHLPVYLNTAKSTRTTNYLINNQLFKQAISSGCIQFEIETYTYSKLNKILKLPTIQTSIQKEYRFVLDKIS